MITISHPLSDIDIYSISYQQIVGSDIAELLMQDSNSDGSWKPDVPTLIDFDEPPAAEALPAKGNDLLTGDPSGLSCESPEKALQGYTQLLLAGRKKVQSFSYLLLSDDWIYLLFLTYHKYITYLRQ